MGARSLTSARWWGGSYEVRQQYRAPGGLTEYLAKCWAEDGSSLFLSTPLEFIPLPPAPDYRAQLQRLVDRAFRKDGWPLCPQCGEDEPYSLAEPASANAIDGCYRCNWKPGKPVIKKVCDLCRSSGECLGVC